jgi:NADH-quinone oxidoreductase subunit A
MVEQLNPYLGIAILGSMTTGFLLFMLALSVWLGPKNPTATKQQPWECGGIPVGSAREQRFGVRFYLVAVLFILFDIEIMFMYPWAVSLRELGINGLLQMVGFMIVLGAGLAYVWRKGALDWNE